MSHGRRVHSSLITFLERDPSLLDSTYTYEAEAITGGGLRGEKRPPRTLRQAGEEESGSWHRGYELQRAIIVFYQTPGGRVWSPHVTLQIEALQRLHQAIFIHHNLFGVFLGKKCQKKSSQKTAAKATCRNMAVIKCRRNRGYRPERKQVVAVVTNN